MKATIPAFRLAMTFVVFSGIFLFFLWVLYASASFKLTGSSAGVPYSMNNIKVAAGLLFGPFILLYFGRGLWVLFKTQILSRRPFLAVGPEGLRWIGFHNEIWTNTLHSINPVPWDQIKNIEYRFHDPYIPTPIIRLILGKGIKYWVLSVTFKKDVRLGWKPFGRKDRRDLQLHHFDVSAKEVIREIKKYKQVTVLPADGQDFPWN